MKVIVWADKIDHLILEKGTFGGLNVQMYFWAKVFLSKGWDVLTFSERDYYQLEGITFIPYSQKGKFRLLKEFFYSFRFILKYSPDLVLVRGARRDLCFIALACRLTNTEMIFMGASDVNFIPGSENISGSKRNQWLYRLGLRLTKRVVVQNQEQQTLLKLNYNKKSRLVPNIWINDFAYEDKDRSNIIWVGNFRSLKRPEWFLNLAKQFPNEHFVMVGNEIDRALYAKCEKIAQKMPNVDFHGGVSFKEVNTLLSQAKLLVCTSEYEGFPNTFLQAWSQKIPVLSTVNPSELLTKKGLGLLITSELELFRVFGHIINNPALYAELTTNIQSYFKNSHLPEVLFDEITRSWEKISKK